MRTSTLIKNAKQTETSHEPWSKDSNKLWGAISQALKAQTEYMELSIIGESSIQSVGSNQPKLKDSNRL